jgi:hypothetical protein
MFDDLLLLSEGRTMYCGLAANAVEYFAHVGYTCPTHYNPGDFVLDTISLDMRSKERESETRQRVQFLADTWSSLFHGSRSVGLGFESSMEGERAAEDWSSAALSRGKLAASVEGSGRRVEETKWSKDQCEVLEEGEGGALETKRRSKLVTRADEQVPATETKEEQEQGALSSRRSSSSSSDLQRPTDGVGSGTSGSVEKVYGDNETNRSAGAYAEKLRAKTSTTAAEKEPLAKALEGTMTTPKELPVRGSWQRAPAAKFFRDLVLLTWRSFVPTYRHVTAFIIRTVTIMIYAVVLSLVYQNTGYTQDAIQGRIGILFFIVINQVRQYV